MQLNRDALPNRTWMVRCVYCGHDAYKGTLDEAMDRAATMAEDHIPYSPDGSLNCDHWSAAPEWDDEMPSADAVRYVPYARGGRQ